MSTAIRIQIKSDLDPETDDDGFPIEKWVDVIDEDILCEWKNWKSKTGAEIYQADALKAKEIALLRLWYIPGIDATCRIVRVEDSAIFDIINIDDVDNRHIQFEIQIKRFVEG